MFGTVESADMIQLGPGIRGVCKRRWNEPIGGFVPIRRDLRHDCRFGSRILFAGTVVAGTVTASPDAEAAAGLTGTDRSGMGALAAFLCDDRVRHMTGATFDVNGASYVR